MQEYLDTSKTLEDPWLFLRTGSPGVTVTQGLGGRDRMGASVLVAAGGECVHEPGRRALLL